MILSYITVFLPFCSPPSLKSTKTLGGEEEWVSEPNVGLWTVLTGTPLSGGVGSVIAMALSVK